MIADHIARTVPSVAEVDSPGSLETSMAFSALEYLHSPDLDPVAPGMTQSMDSFGEELALPAEGIAVMLSSAGHSVVSSDTGRRLALLHKRKTI